MVLKNERGLENESRTEGLIEIEVEMAREFSPIERSTRKLVVKELVKHQLITCSSWSSAGTHQF